MAAVALTSLCSFTFHARENSVTELLDSCSSLLPLISSLAILAHRSLRMSGNLILLATTLLYLAVVLALVLLTPDHYTLFQVPLSLFDMSCIWLYHLGVVHILSNHG